VNDAVNDGWFDELDGLGLVEAIREGDLSAVEVVDTAIRRIEARNPVVNAVIAERFAAAHDEAEALATGPRRDGLFAGVPFLVKPIGAGVAGLPMSQASRLFADDVAHDDSIAVARARRAGMIVLGMTNMPELGKNASTEPVLFGPTRNPHDGTRSAGGSSGGSGAAVASGMTPIAHANDGGGSLRIPASANGLFGLKPSRGRVMAAPYFEAFGSPEVVTHALTRTVRDSAAMLDVLAVHEPGDPFAVVPPGRPFLDEVAAGAPCLRIGVLTTTAHGEPASRECRDAVARAAATCEALGHVVTESTFSYDVALLERVLITITAVETASAIDQRLGDLGRSLADDEVEPFTRFLYDHGQTVTGADLADALRGTERIGREVAPFFTEHDVLLTPTMASPPPPLGWVDTTRLETMARMGPLTAFTAVFNVTGQPAMSVPFGVDADGVPIGVQFVAGWGGEALLFQLAGDLERAAPWPARPVVPGLVEDG
jgi:amidase